MNSKKAKRCDPHIQQAKYFAQLVHSGSAITAVAPAWSRLWQWPMLDAFALSSMYFFSTHALPTSAHPFILHMQSFALRKKESNATKKPFVYIINDSDWGNCWHKWYSVDVNVCLNVVHFATIWKKPLNSGKHCIKILIVYIRLLAWFWLLRCRKRSWTNNEYSQWKKKRHLKRHKLLFLTTKARRYLFAARHPLPSECTRELPFKRIII